MKLIEFADYPDRSEKIRRREVIGLFPFIA